MTTYYLKQKGFSENGNVEMTFQQLAELIDDAKREFIKNHYKELSDADDDNGFDDDDYDDPVDLFESCDYCGLTDSHSIECPMDNDPFNELIKNGYD